ncbi:MAG: thermonuclease family protein [Desulfobacterales bacterium]|jgi:endonuclease YncB( thermonuclease family)
MGRRSVKNHAQSEGPIAKDYRRCLLGGLFIVLISLVAAAPALAGDLIAARVIGVTDGDSVIVLEDGNNRVKIRLHGVDCPEIGQASGAEAKNFTSGLSFGKAIEYRLVGIDKFGSTVATVYLDDGRELNLEIIKAGLGWYEKRYLKRPDYADAEAQARKDKIGLWADPDPLSPWEWRRKKGAKP